MAVFAALALLAIVPQIMSVPDVVDVDWLVKNKKSVVILDVTPDQKPKPDPEEFKKKYYAHFEEMMKEKPKAYLEEHIPGAVLYDINAAHFPSKYIIFDLYPPEEFEKYIRLLGVNNDDHVVVYGRGSFAGMMWASRAWWTFKLYGHDKVSVLDGGLDAWKKAGQPVTGGDVVVVKPGNWKAKPINPALLITFEELDKKNADRKSLLEELDKINYLDARPAGMYDGSAPLGHPAEGATGAHLKGAKSVPLALLYSENGIRSKKEIRHVLEKAGYKEGLPTVTSCVSGVQASLLGLALSHIGVRYRVYNGSMAEIGLRAPQLISEK